MRREINTHINASRGPSSPITRSMGRLTLSTVGVTLAAWALAACASAPGPAPSKVASSPPTTDSNALVVGKPAPISIKAERSFILPIAGDVLEARRRKAAVRVPLIYSYTRPRGGFEAQKRRIVREFNRWLGAIRRRRVRNMAQFKKAYARHGKVLGTQLSESAFDRLRRASRWRLSATFSALVRHGFAPYIVEARGLPEKHVEVPHAVLRTAGRKGKWRDKRLELKQIKDLREARAGVEAAAQEHGKKLAPAVRAELVSIASARLAPTLKLDRVRMRAAWVDARSKVKRTPLTFVEGQPIVEKGKLFTEELRATLAFMRSARCEPCTSGRGPCSGGLLQRLRLGGRVMRPIKATRSFIVRVDEERRRVIRAQASEVVPRVFVIDARVARGREAKLRKILAQASKLEGDKRWDKLLDAVETSLGVKLLPQLVEPLESVPWKELRAALLALYRHAQAEPITVDGPVSASAPCTLRDGQRRAAREKTHLRCPVLPLARLRLDLPLRAGQYIALLAKMPDETQRALIELVQHLLVGNTKLDPAETKLRKEKAAAKAKGEERFYVKGDVVFPAGRALTRVDRHTLEKMFALKCRAVGRR